MLYVYSTFNVLVNFTFQSAKQETFCVFEIVDPTL